jgi:hypothetical protein
METIARSTQENSIPEAGKVVEIDFKELKVDDFILIRTRNSVYSFWITDAEQMRGKLAGGANLMDPSEAVLLGARFKRGLRVAAASGLKTDGRALFLINRGSEVKELLTSAITKLVCVRASAGCFAR